MKKNLEDEILSKVYQYETKRTAFDLFLRVFLIIVIATIVLLFGSVLWDYLSDQQTFDTLDIFHDDFEIIREYVSQILSVFYNETPHTILAIFLIGFTFLSYCILTFVRNFERIKRKVLSLVHYWRSH